MKDLFPNIHMMNLMILSVAHAFVPWPVGGYKDEADTLKLASAADLYGLTKMVPWKNEVAPLASGDFCNPCGEGCLPLPSDLIAVKKSWENTLANIALAYIPGARGTPCPSLVQA